MFSTKEEMASGSSAVEEPSHVAVDSTYAYDALIAAAKSGNTRPYL